MSAKRKTQHKLHHKSHPSRQMSHRNDHRNDPWKISMDGLRLQSITKTRCEPHHQAESKTSWLPRKTVQGADCSIIIVLVQQATTTTQGCTWLPKLTIQGIGVVKSYDKRAAASKLKSFQAGDEGDAGGRQPRGAIDKFPNGKLFRFLLHCNHPESRPIHPLRHAGAGTIVHVLAVVKRT
ncbi:hypothetical protein M5K25_026170 [Dendrobium thyrsiflorum]|uniref:Uncharacterized protein n=1 Tax=Dendrobium thyrsiflorum TaxID=117978 RepID=A0ABD0TWS6_DENTH